MSLKSKNLFRYIANKAKSEAKGGVNNLRNYWGNLVSAIDIASKKKSDANNSRDKTEYKVSDAADLNQRRKKAELKSGGGTVSPQPVPVIVKEAHTIIKQDAELLAELKIPAAEKILLTENCVRKNAESLKMVKYMQSCYTKRGGIREKLLMIIGFADYVPDGLRHTNVEQGTVPLHSAVYNTFISSIINDFDSMQSCIRGLEVLQTAEPAEPTEEEIKEVVASVEDALLNDRENLKQQIDSYIFRYKRAQELLEGYEICVEKNKGVTLEMIHELSELLQSDECRALVACPCNHEDEPVVMVMNNEDITLSAEANQYYRILCAFKPIAKQFADKWTDESFYGESSDV